ncbi:hypothetical protein MTO96_027700 [Rhipicephalus appendiculatus]
MFLPLSRGAVLSAFGRRRAESIRQSPAVMTKRNSFTACFVVADRRDSLLDGAPKASCMATRARFASLDVRRFLDVSSTPEDTKGRNPADTFFPTPLSTGSSRRLCFRDSSASWRAHVETAVRSPQVLGFDHYIPAGERKNASLSFLA